MGGRLINLGICGYGHFIAIGDAIIVVIPQITLILRTLVYLRIIFVDFIKSIDLQVRRKIDWLRLLIFWW